MSKKYRTIEQVETAQQRAVRFAQNVLADDDKAAELASLTPEEYADRKRIQIINPERNRPTMPKAPTRADLEQRIEELEEENAQMAERLDQISELSSGSDDEEDEEDEEEEEGGDQDDDE